MGTAAGVILVNRSCTVVVALLIRIPQGTTQGKGRTRVPTGHVAKPVLQLLASCGETRMLQLALQHLKVAPVQGIGARTVTFREGADLSSSPSTMGIFQFHAQALILPVFPVTPPAPQGERSPTQLPMIRHHGLSLNWTQ